MWIMFSIFSMIAFAAADLMGKKKVDKGSETASLELIVSYEAIAVLFSVILWTFRLGESGQTPWRIILSHPLILANQFLSLVYWLLFLLSMRYVGLSVQEAVSGAFGIFYFSGLLILNLITGKLAAVRNMLHPMRFIPIILVIICTFLLTDTEIFVQRRAGSLPAKMRYERRRFIFGLLILLIATAFDSADSLIVALIFDEKSIGTIDYIMASQLINILPMLFFLNYIKIKGKKRYIQLVRGEKYCLAVGAFFLLSIILYMIAASLDSVRSGILFIIYPIVPILGAKIFLKEKYTLRQNMCIWVITIASIVFGAADYVL